MRLTILLSGLLFHSASTAESRLLFTVDEWKHFSDVTSSEENTSNTLGHYGKPPVDCEKDEKALEVQGIPGAFCSPMCNDFLPCPSDMGPGVTASPMCALQEQTTGKQYCVLVCYPGKSKSLRGGDSQCGDATCQPAPGQDGIGICTYDVDTASQ